MVHANGTRESGSVPPDKRRYAMMTTIETEQKEFKRRFPRRQSYDYYNNFFLHLYYDSKGVHLGQRAIIRALGLWDTEFRNHTHALKEWSAKKKNLTSGEFYKEVDEVVKESQQDVSIPAASRLTDSDLASLILYHSGPGASPEKLEKLYHDKLAEIFIRLRMRGYNYYDLTQ